MIGIGGSLIALDIAGLISGLRLASALGINARSSIVWFPLAMLDPGLVKFGPFRPGGVEIPWNGAIAANGRATHASDVLLPAIGGLTVVMLLGTSFALAYAMRAARTIPPGAAEATTDKPAAFAVSTRTRAVVGGIGCAALGTWAWVVGIVAIPHRGLPSGNPTGADTIMWSGLLGIVLVVLALVTLLAGRGPVVAPAVAAFIVLCAVQSTISKNQWHGAAVTVAAITVGVATAAGAWWLARAITGPGTTATTTRRALIAVAVASALVTPLPSTPIRQLRRRTPWRNTWPPHCVGSSPRLPPPLPARLRCRGSPRPR